jgi:hypothetical protein
MEFVKNEEEVLDHVLVVVFLEILVKLECVAHQAVEKCQK